MPRPERDRKRGPRLSLFLQVTQPVKIDGGWEVKAVSTVLYGSRAPEPPREIIFVVDGAEYERAVSDSDSGMASSVMLFQEIGEHLITVYISDFLSVRRSHRFMIKEEKEKTPDEKELAVIKAQIECAKAKKELKEITPPEGRRKLKIIRSLKESSGLRVILQRFGKDGESEAGAISSWEVEQEGEVRFERPSVLVNNLGRAIVFLPFSVHQRTVAFYLPDDIGVEVAVEVPSSAGKDESAEVKTEVKSAGQRISEAFQRGRRGEFLAANDSAKILPLAAVAGGVIATLLVFRGPESGDK